MPQFMVAGIMAGQFLNDFTSVRTSAKAKNRRRSAERSPNHSDTALSHSNSIFRDEAVLREVGSQTQGNRFKRAASSSVRRLSD